jgi:Tol biopolymer transport system component
LAFTPGTRLGVYEVTVQIGQGGMGEVWRARDTQLNRDVALKVLPDSFANDPDRLARFTREAQTLAALNHPNIAAIYGIEAHALVMELVEGEDLSQRIARGAISIDEALPIAKQIADALEAAHEQGIIHRDLKPANVKVRADGTVKVLDFGLAKAMDPVGMPGADATTSPTLTARATQMGTMLGTAAYMAPEQARGKVADKRADVWAFGVLLYEMLTGRRAFEGEEISDVLAAVLRGEPDWAALPAATPPGLRRTLLRCVEKDRKKRLRDIGDVGILMEDVATSETAGWAVAAASRRAIYAAWSLGAVLLLSLAALAFAYRPQPASERHPVRFSVPAPENAAYAVLAPDGGRLVIKTRDAATALWVREFDSLEARPLPDTENGANPFWAPDSRRVGFFANGVLKTIDIQTGVVHTLCPAPGGGRGGTWNSTGTVLFTSANLQGLFRVSEVGGPPSRVTTTEGLPPGAYRYPTFLPDGRRFLFMTVPANEIRQGSLDATGSTKVMDAESQVLFIPPGDLLFARQGMLLVQPFDVGTATPRGAPTLVAEHVIDNGIGLAGFSASNAGVLAYITGTSAELSRLSWFDRLGNPAGTVGPPGRYRNPELSPDQKSVAVELLGDDGNRDVVRIDVATGDVTRVTFDPQDDVFPIWSPDGARIAFGSDRDGGTFSIYSRPSNLSTTEDLLFKSTVENAVPYSWSPDGHYILHRSMNRGSYNTGVLPVDGDHQSHLYDPEDYSLINAQVSPPDGRLIAYHSNANGQYDVYMQTFPVPGGKQAISTAGGYYAKWRADGREIFYYAADGQLMARTVTMGSGMAPALGSPKQLFRARMLNGPSSTVGFRAQYDVSKDGQRFLINVPIEESQTRSTIVELNWMAGRAANR